jgi:hypothetical protein
LDSPSKSLRSSPGDKSDGKLEAGCELNSTPYTKVDMESIITEKHAAMNLATLKIRGERSYAIIFSLADILVILQCSTLQQAQPHPFGGHFLKKDDLVGSSGYFLKR